MGRDAGGADGAGFNIGGAEGLGGGGDAGATGRIDAGPNGAGWDKPGGGAVVARTDGGWRQNPEVAAEPGHSTRDSPAGAKEPKVTLARVRWATGARGGIMGAPAAGSGALRPVKASSATCLSKIAVFSSSSSQSMSIELVEATRDSTSWEPWELGPSTEVPAACPAKRVRAC